MIAAFSDHHIRVIDNFFRRWIDSETRIPQIADVNKFLEQTPKSGGLKKFEHFDGTWQEYLEYCEANGILSRNFTRIDGKLTLRPGYIPPYTLKDFK